MKTYGRGGCDSRELSFEVKCAIGFAHVEVGSERVAAAVSQALLCGLNAFWGVFVDGNGQRKPLEFMKVPGCRRGRANGVKRALRWNAGHEVC